MDGKGKRLKDAYGIAVSNASKTCTYEYFNQVESKRTKKGARNISRNNNETNYVNPDIQEFIDAYASIDSTKSIHKVRTAVFHLKLSDIKKTLHT